MGRCRGEREIFFTCKPQLTASTVTQIYTCFPVEEADWGFMSALRGLSLLLHTSGRPKEARAREIFILPPSFLTSSCTDSLNPMQSVSLSGGLQVFAWASSLAAAACLSLRSEDYLGWVGKERNQLVAQLLEASIALPAQWDCGGGNMGARGATTSSTSHSKQPTFGF